MPKLNVQQNNANVIKALRNALAIGQIKGPIASDGNDNFTSTGSNRNLLDNWYFVGGGSQLGDGVFPINQRGQTSYSGSANIFDRWTLQNAFATLASDAVYFGSTTQNVWGLMQQVPSCFRNLWGKTVTVSAILNNDELVQGTYTIPSSGAFDMPAAGSGGVFVNLYSYDGSNIVFRIYTQYTAQYHIKAVKLELGTVSTLANDAPPDYGTELAKCKQYYREIVCTARGRLFLGIGFGTTGVEVPNIFGVGNEMRTTSPNVTVTGSLYVSIGSDIAVTSVSKNFSNSNFGLSFNTAGGITAQTVYSVIGSAGAKITFSADL